MTQQNVGLLLARCAARNSLTVLQISKATGATRQTVYNWLSGGSISPAYRTIVGRLINKMCGKGASK